MIYSDLSAVDSCGILLGTYFQLFEMYWVTVYYIGLLFDQSFEVLYVLIPSTSGVIQMPHFGGESGSPPGSGGGGFQGCRVVEFRIKDLLTPMKLASFDCDVK